MARSKKKLGEILIVEGKATPEQIQEALKIAQGSGKRIGEVLIDTGVVSEDDVAKGLARQFRLKYADLSNPEIAARVDTSLLDAEIINKYKVLPLAKQGNKLHLIVPDPKNLELMDMLRFRLGLEIDPKLAGRGAIQKYIDEQMGAGSGGEVAKPQESLITASIDKSIDKSVDKSVDASIDKAADSAPIIKLVDRIIEEAVLGRASDIHVEPMEDRVRLRYRVDGVCVERDNLPKRMQNAILARFKLMAGVNIAEKRIPQDGRIKMPITNNEGETTTVDFRVSACPAFHGESIVLRILRPDSVRIGLENLGFEADNLATFNKIIRKPNGIFLVTGPTGSGKTTTLYTALDILNRPDKKIITAEDPIEYAFNGINQCQVRENIGLTFSKVLRAMLRQAPNIILVGEIRDKEVAEVAIQAALTGHLVFSTLHTNDAPSAMTRLIDMGVKPFLVASSIQAVLAQRLMRVVDQETKVPDDNPDPKFLRLCGITPEDREKHTIYKAVPTAKNNGYKGRRGIFEMMMMNSRLRDLTFNCAPSSQLRRVAIESGMSTLIEDGKKKILKGITTPEEIARIAQTDEIGEGGGGSNPDEDNHANTEEAASVA